MWTSLSFYKGYHGDLNETFCVGECDAESKRLVQTTAQARPSPVASLQQHARCDMVAA